MVLFKDLAIVFAAALLLVLITQRLKLPTLLSYLAVGIALGPYGLKIISASSEVNALGEIGVALLMFAVGVEFSFKKLSSVKKVALWGGMLQIILIILLTAIFGFVLKWPLNTTILLGCIAAISSTMIVMKTLTERNETNSLHAQIMLGILIVQDLAVVVMVAMMPFLVSNINSPQTIFTGIATASAYLVLAFLVVRGILPQLMMRIAQTQNKELFNLSVVGICLGAAIGSFYLGLSLALGAFLAGLILGESDYHQQISATIAPLRDLFAMIFFVAIGMMLDFSAFVSNFWFFMVLLFIIIIIKPLITMVIIRAYNYSPRTSFLCAAGMGQIGEFSFLIASLGLVKGILSANAYSVVMSAAIASLVLSPFASAAAPFIYRNLTQAPFWRKKLGKHEVPDTITDDFNFSDHIIICGNPNICTELLQFLNRKQIPWAVLDDSHALAEFQPDKHSAYIYGDPSNESLLARLNPAHAKAATIWLHDTEASCAAINVLRRINPDLPIVASVSNSEAAAKVIKSGANHIIMPEFEASLEVLRYLMLTLNMPLDESQRYIEGIRLHRFHQFPHKPQQHSLEKFSEHYILCGFGRLGRAVSRQLNAAGVPHVAVELDPERARRYGDSDTPILWGNAIKDKVLLQAGIKKAKGLVVAADNDSVNMHIILTARRLNTNLDIIAYGRHQEAAENLKQAGARKIYSPYDLGGMRIAASIVSPAAADLMEKLIAPATPGMEIAEIKLEQGSSLAGLSLRDSHLRENTGATIIAVLSLKSGLKVNPKPETYLNTGDFLIVMGTKPQLEKAKKQAL
ncbi:MAG: cation:proton antiporter [Armatimonadota bacterium]